jgi:hypothetical protein
VTNGSCCSRQGAPPTGNGNADKGRHGLVGLIVSLNSGTLRFDRVDSEKHLLAWRLRAAQARRSGLYSLDDPDSLTAVVPS